MIYIKYQVPDDEGFTIWEMPQDLSKERCIYVSVGLMVSNSKQWQEYTEDTVWHDLENCNIAEVITFDQAVLEMI